MQEILCKPNKALAEGCLVVAGKPRANTAHSAQEYKEKANTIDHTKNKKPQFPQSTSEKVIM